MSTEQILALLIGERDKLNRAIEALADPIKRRGRPPKNPDADPTMSEWVKPKSELGKTRKGRTFTAAQRKAFGERMKAYWAAKRRRKKG